MLQINNYNIENFERFSAIKPNFEDINQLFIIIIQHICQKIKKYIMVQQDVNFHMRYYKRCIKENYENILIFEDDF